MPNYVPTALYTAQAKIIAKAQAAELRIREPRVFKTIKASGDLILNTKDLRTREDRAVEAPYLLRSSRTANIQRTHDHTGVAGDSGIMSLAYTTYGDKFSISLKQAGKNFFSQEEMFMNEVTNVIGNCIESIELAATNFLFSNKSGVNPVNVEGVYNTTSDTFEVSELTNGQRFVQIIKSTMRLLKYTGTLDVYCNTVAYNKIQYQLAQGSANQNNLSFQDGGINYINADFLGGIVAGVTETAAYTKGYCIAVPTGTVGVADWIPAENRRGYQSEVQTYGTFSNPVDGLLYASHIYRARANGTTVGGFTQDEITQYEYTVDLAFEKAPLSVSTESSIFAFALV
jgi:hypothetical protein